MEPLAAMLKVKYSFQKQFMEPKVFFSVKLSSSNWLIVFVFPDNIKHVSQIMYSEPAQKTFWLHLVYKVWYQLPEATHFDVGQMLGICA